MKGLFSIRQRGGICNMRGRMPRLRFCLILSLFILLFNITPSNAWAMGGKQPPLNEPAPEFVLPTNTGDGDIALQDYRGQWV